MIRTHRLFFLILFFSGALSFGEPGPTVSLLAGGDVMLGHRLLPLLAEKGPHFPFDSLRPVIGSAHIALANLEAPFTEGGSPFPKTYTFHVPPYYVEGLVRAGFDLLTLANNHLLDYGIAGLRSTLETLDQAGLAYCGAGMNRDEALRPVVLEKNGLRIGFLAFSFTHPDAFWATSHRPGTAYGDPFLLARHIQDLKTRVDGVVISVHWGEESRETPKDYQRENAHRFIDAGADLVVGHHPHVLQGIEIYRGKLIAYSVGNLVFGTYGESARDGLLLRVVLSREGPIQAEALPLCVDNRRNGFCPRLHRREARLRVIRYLNALSRPLNNGREVVDPQGRILLTPALSEIGR